MTAVSANQQSPQDSTSVVAWDALAQKNTTFQWLSDPRWAASGDDVFLIRKSEYGELVIYDGAGEEEDVLEDHDLYQTGDEVTIQYLMEDGRPFATRGRVLGYAGLAKVLYVETHDSMAVWIDPNIGDRSTWINGKPQMLKHQPNLVPELDVDINRIRRRVVAFNDATAANPELVTSLFFRARTWVCHRPLYSGQFLVAPAIITAYQMPSAVEGDILEAYAQIASKFTKAQTVQARTALQHVMPYGLKGRMSKDRGRGEVRAFAEKFGLRLRKDFRVLQGHCPF